MLLSKLIRPFQKLILITKLLCAYCTIGAKNYVKFKLTPSNSFTVYGSLIQSSIRFYISDFIFSNIFS